MIGSLDRFRVLIVDDIETSVRLAQAMLRAIGVEKMFVAYSGQDAVTFLGSQGHEIKLIMCDWNMPKMSGLPFPMVTGHSDKDMVLIAASHGVTGYLVKPDSMNQLKQKLQSVISEDSTEADCGPDTPAAA